MIAFLVSVELSELDGVNELNGSVGGNNGLSSAGLERNSLESYEGLVGFSFTLGGIVGVNAVNEGGSGARHAGVFNADVDSLGDDSSTDTLVDDNTEGVLGDIEKNSNPQTLQ